MSDGIRRAAGVRPNIIFILCDDLGYGDVGAFYQNERGAGGFPCHLTPNLDRLANEGVQLRDHYTAAPVCAPAGASLLTGLHQGHANIRNNQFNKALEENHTLASTLKAAGYATAAIGKWGLQGALPVEDREKGCPEVWPAFPTKRGFDCFFGYVRHIDGHENYPMEGLYQGRTEVWDGEKEVSAKLKGCYTTDLFTARAKKWIVEQSDADSLRPFFLYLAFDTPHAVLQYPPSPFPEGGDLEGGLQWTGQPGRAVNAAGTPDSYCHPDYAEATYVGLPMDGPVSAEDRVENRPWPEVCKRYATSVRRIDHGVGDLMQTLRELRLDHNTLVVFSSDNGPSTESYLNDATPMFPAFFRSFGPFDGLNRDCWEGGIRVGAIARWPGKILSGRILRQSSQFHDWLPTFVEAAGLPPPARTDGVSLLPELVGEGEWTPSLIYSEYLHDGSTEGLPEFAPAHRNRMRGQMQVIRIGKYKGVRYDTSSAADDFEIYDVSRDSQECYDLGAERRDLEEIFKARVLQVRLPDPLAPRPYDNASVPAIFPMPTAAGVFWRLSEGKFPWLPKIAGYSQRKRIPVCPARQRRKPAARSRHNGRG